MYTLNQPQQKPKASTRTSQRRTKYRTSSGKSQAQKALGEIDTSLMSGFKQPDISGGEAAGYYRTSLNDYKAANSTVDVSPKAEAADQAHVNKNLPLREGGVDYSNASNIADFIKAAEGLKLEAYDDVQQVSIGYGSKGVKGEIITEEEANKRLTADIENARSIVMKANEKYGYNWNENQIDALVSFTHNLGANKGGFSSLIDNGQRSNAEIIRFLPKYNKARLGEGGELIELKGLTERRAAEVKLFTQGYGS